jgi:hypothetical protein
VTVYACWEKARGEFPDDPERRKYRYVELMREHGHIVPGIVIRWTEPCCKAQR